MQNLASEFSKIFWGDTLGPPQREGPTPSRTHPQPSLCTGAGCKRPGVGTQTLVPLNFSGVVAPLTMYDWLIDWLIDCSVTLTTLFRVQHHSDNHLFIFSYAVNHCISQIMYSWIIGVHVACRWRWLRSVSVVVRHCDSQHADCSTSWSQRQIVAGLRDSLDDRGRHRSVPTANTRQHSALLVDLLYRLIYIRTYRVVMVAVDRSKCRCCCCG